MNNRNYLGPFLVFVLLLSGCAIPGAHLTINDKEMVGEPEEKLSDLVEVQPITVDVLRKAKADTYGNAGPTSNPELEKEINDYQYRIGKGDVLNITVWDHPELTIPAGQYRSSSETGNWVNQSGNIFYPYIGEVPVEGKTIDEVREVITKRLAKFVEKPQVDVNIAAFRSQKVFVTGEVNKPGNVPVTNIPLTLLDAINQADGFTEKADWTHVTLHRNGKNEMLSFQNMLHDGEMTQNRLLLPGDIAHVGSIEDRKVYVMGSVNKAGTLPIGRNGLSLTESISNAGGLNETIADATGIFVIRRIAELGQTGKKDEASGNKRETKKLARVYQLDLSDATAMVLGVDFPLKENDVVYVTTAPIARWARIVNQIFPTLLTIDIIDRVGGR